LANFIHTACPYDCPDACSFLVRKESDGSLDIKPNPEMPIGEKFICPKGSRWDRVRNHPSRITTPLKRTGSSWDPISWDEAFSLWAAYSSESISRLGPLSNFFLRGYGSLYFSKNLLKNVFADTGGYTSTTGSLCGAAGGAGLKKTFGFTPVMLPDTIASHSRGVLLWGRNAAETNVHLLPILKRVKERGGSISAIEIRQTATTDLCDSWWRVRPGSDGILALLISARILATGSAFPSWEKSVSNPEAFRDLIKGFDLDSAMRTTGLSESDIDAIQSWLQSNSPVAIYPGYGVQRYFAGSDTFHALAALSVLLGGLAERGSGLVFGKDEMALFPEKLLRGAPVVRKLPVSSWYTNGEIIPPVGVAVICGANPAKQSPGTNTFASAMSRIPFKVCVDLFLTETARMCDLFLPTTLFLEEGPDWRGSWWHNFLSRSEKVVDPPKGVLNDLEIFSGYARKMGLHTDLAAERLEMDRMILSDIRLKRISEGVFSWDEPEVWGKGGALARMPEVAPPKSDFSEGLRLVAVHSKDYINGQTAGSRAENEEVLEICLSPSALDRLGMKGGTRVIIRGGSGSLEGMLRSDPGMGEGFCVVRQGIPGVNSLTVAAASPGYGAPFNENGVHIAPFSGDKSSA
jgi:anaerobic selenocysteine-containing dehydrogenase